MVCGFLDHCRALRIEFRAWPNSLNASGVPAAFKIKINQLTTYFTYWTSYVPVKFFGLQVVLAEINEWFIEDQAFLPSYDLAPLPLFPVRKIYRRHAGRLRKRNCWRERGWGRSQIIREQENLVIYKSFKTLCRKIYLCLIRMQEDSQPPG